jgi:beta-galactosidase/beta-glucuronidase
MIHENKLGFAEMKRTLLPCIFLILAVAVNAQWKPAGDRIKTIWAEKMDPQNVLPEYPRPVMERSEWKNLNGLWDYAVAPVGKRQPKSFDGQILVPFAIESSLSGVQRPLGSDNELWYKRVFTLPSSWKNKHIILHFGAVDWKTDVFIKVEPARWYTHCDRTGMLVWQDMPSGDNNWGLQRTDYSRDYLDTGKEDTSTGRARENYIKEWKEIIDELYSYPCIVMWIPFNEGWGQFDTKQIPEQTENVQSLFRRSLYTDYRCRRGSKRINNL